MTTTTDPAWISRECFRGHSLQEHGIPRAAAPHKFHCRACRREWSREAVERNRGRDRYGWRGGVHMCSHVHEPCEVDEASVLRLMAGNPPDSVHWVDRFEAVLRLTAAGMSAAQIAQRVGCVPRTVTRVRVRSRKELAHGQAS